MTQLVQQLLAGMANGALYACLALALVIIYRTTNHVNFAQGEMAMFSTFVAWACLQAGLPYWLMIIAALAFGFGMAVLLERLVLRPLHGPIASSVVAFIALLMIFQSAAGWIFGYTTKSFPSPFELDELRNRFLSPHDAGIIGISLVLLFAVFLFFKFTRIGLALRAVADNPLSGHLVGINVGAMVTCAWGLAGAIGAITGVMAAPKIFLEPHMMSGILLYAFAGAILGGIDRPVGAVAGGFIVGIAENLLGAYLAATELKLSLALLIIIGVLVLRPAGLFSKAPEVRV